MKHLLLAFSLAVQLATPATAGGNLIDQWYSALKSSDREAFDRLLSPDAKIVLGDLGITQTREEFLEALDNWEDAAATLTLSYTQEGVDASSATAEVCYAFPSNSFTNLEVFYFQEDKIVRQEQEKMRDGC